MTEEIRRECRVCHQVKSAPDLVKNKKCAGGYDKLCRDCRKRPEQKAKDRARRTQWRQANRDLAVAKLREWRATLSDEQRTEYSRKDYERNKAWRATHPERTRETGRLCAQRRAARKREAGGNITAQEWRALKAKYNHTCLRCGRSEPEIKLEIDHVVPLARGGSHTAANIQPLCRSCNASKCAHTIDYRPSYRAS